MKTGNLIGMANSILGNHLVGVCADGHVLATGNNTDGQCDVRTWTDITAVACGAGFTVGLRADGTVLAVGDNYYGQCNVTEWQDVSAIACGDYHTVGLKKDGTLIAAGRNDDGQCNIDGWANVIKIICMGYETIALCKNGTVLCTGESLRDNDMENIKELSVGSSLLGLRKDGSVACPFQADEVRRGIDNWKDLVSAVEVEYLIYGLRKDGVIISAKQLPWEDIISIAGNEYLVGLRKDGTVVTLGNADVSDWKDVIMIRCYGPFQQTIVGVCRDGRVLTTNEDFDVAGWRLFNSIDTLEQGRAEGPAHAKAERIAKEKAEAKRRAQKRAALLAEQNELQAELSQLKGLFSGKRRREIEARLAELSTALRELEEKHETEQREISDDSDSCHCAGCISGAGLCDPVRKDRCVLAGAGVYAGSIRCAAICSETVVYKGQGRAQQILRFPNRAYWCRVFDCANRAELFVHGNRKNLRSMDRSHCLCADVGCCRRWHHCCGCHARRSRASGCAAQNRRGRHARAAIPRGSACFSL